MKQVPTLLAAIAATALVLACSKGTEAPSAPGTVPGLTALRCV